MPKDLPDRVPPLVALVTDAVGPIVIGAYLHGSAVLGGLRPASDLDILVLVQRRTRDGERRALLDGLLRISAAGHRPVELTVVAEPDLRPWRYPPVVDFQYGEWLRDTLVAEGPAQPRPHPDLVIQLASVLASDCALLGVPPGRVLQAIPRSDLVRASTAGLPSLRADLAHDTRNVLLTVARVWYTVVTGEITSKDAAADWAVPQLPTEQRAVLEYARRQYLDRRYSEDGWGRDRQAMARRCLDSMVAVIDRLAPRW